MNPTEHGLKMAFDPDYEEKWEVLVEMRKSRRVMFAQCFINYMVWTLLLSAIFPNLWSLFINPTLYLLVSYVYCRYIDRVMRRRLKM